jgi:hypothetical protein
VAALAGSAAIAVSCGAFGKLDNSYYIRTSAAVILVAIALLTMLLPSFPSTQAIPTLASSSSRMKVSSPASGLVKRTQATSKILYKRVTESIQFSFSDNARPHIQSTRYRHVTLRSLTEAKCWEGTDLLAGLGSVKQPIAAVTRIEHSFQTRYVQATMQQYKTQDARHPSPIWVWYGARLDVVERILSEGFSLPPVKRGTGVGRALPHGVYFANHEDLEASMEHAWPGRDGHRHILLCQLYASKVEPFADQVNQFQGTAGADAARDGNTIVF